MKTLTVATDGCVKGKFNKGDKAVGHSACGFIVVNDKNKTVITHQAKYLGKRTISEAEYYGLIDALTFLQENGYTKSIITLYMDSEFIVKQMSGEYKCNAENIFPLFCRAGELSRNFLNLRIVHHSREAQLAKAVDRLVTKQCQESVKALCADTEAT